MPSSIIWGEVTEVVACRDKRSGADGVVASIFFSFPTLPKRPFWVDYIPHAFRVRNELTSRLNEMKQFEHGALDEATILELGGMGLEGSVMSDDFILELSSVGAPNALEELVVAAQKYVDDISTYDEIVGVARDEIEFLQHLGCRPVVVAGAPPDDISQDVLLQVHNFLDFFGDLLTEETRRNRDTKADNDDIISEVEEVLGVIGSKLR